MIARIIEGIFDDGRMYRPVVIAISVVSLDQKHCIRSGPAPLTWAPAARSCIPAPEDKPMSGQPATMMQKAAATWAEWKPIATGVAIGLIAGPIVSGIAGFQTRTSTAEAASRAGIIEQQAMFCAARPPTGTPATSWRANGPSCRAPPPPTPKWSTPAPASSQAEVMPSRSHRAELVFHLPFRLKGSAAPEPAGTYTVETEEELIEGLSFPAWRRVSTTLTRQAMGSATIQALPITPQELAELQAADARSLGP
jgi:hypothetical protein